jgi:hypothetical protein
MTKDKTVVLVLSVTFSTLALVGGIFNGTAGEMGAQFGLEGIWGTVVGAISLLWGGAGMGTAIANYYFGVDAQMRIKGRRFGEAVKETWFIGVVFLLIGVLAGPIYTIITLKKIKE